MDEEVKGNLSYLCTLANDLIYRLGEYDVPFEFAEYISNMVSENGYCDIEDYLDCYHREE